MANQEPSFTQEIRNLIDWEIAILDHRVETLARRSSDPSRPGILQKLELKHQATLQALSAFQLEMQFVVEQDINNWKAFWKEYPNLTLPPGAKSALSVNAVAIKNQDKTALIGALNTWIAATNVDLSFAPPRSSEEFAQIQANQKNWKPGDVQRYKRLLLELCIPEMRHRPLYQLAKDSGPRYWRPNDPVVLISGIKPTPRHGQDSGSPEALRKCTMASLTMGPNGPDSTSLQNLGQATPAAPQADWHPILMDWEAEFSQIQQKSGSGFEPGFIADHFDLATADFQAKTSKLSYDSPTSISGRSVLSPYGNLKLRDTLGRRLADHLWQQCKQELKTPSPDISQFNKWVTSLDGSIINLPQVVLGQESEPRIISWLENCLTGPGPDGPKLAAAYLSHLGSVGSMPILNQYTQETGQNLASLTTNLDGFISWCQQKLNLQEAFLQIHPDAQKEQVPLTVWLAESGAHQEEFAEYLLKPMGLFWEQWAIQHHDSEKSLAQHAGPALQDFQAAVRKALHLVLEVATYQKLAGIHGLAQVLGGFDQAMVQHKLAMQLEVKDPFPASDDKSPADPQFAERVRAAVLAQNMAAPNDGFNLTPIRAGKLMIGQLLLIDTYGQSWGWGKQANAYPNLIPSAPMEGGAANEAMLLPRFAQPTRLNFRWLSAWHDLVEMNGHPATNPICGWILPNNLDQSIMIYGAQGEAYGYVDQEGIWRVFPGKPGPVIPESIPNRHLARVVTWLCEKGQSDSSYITNFLSRLNLVMENIEPENFAQHEAISLLMGKPLAVVRASLNLELKDHLAIDLKPKTFSYDCRAFYKQYPNSEPGKVPDPQVGLDAFPRSTFRYEQVEVPVRIGEYRQLNDGTVGYWLEMEDGSLGDALQIPESETPPPNLTLTLAQKQDTTLTLLLDPRGKVHASSGVQPVKEIHIPSDQYMEALKTIEIAFLTTPILTPHTGIHLSLPTEPGYAWGWVEKDGKGWKETSTAGTLQLADLERAFKAQAANIWGLLTAKGWITPLGNNRARVIPTDQRAEPSLGKAFEALEPLIEVVLESTHVNPFNPSATFEGPLEIREGWLTLNTSNN